MKPLAVDIAVLGSGFAGSLMALIARRLGLTVALIDKGAHPRFAIGESSTPIANMVLRALANRYDLERLVPLCKFGSWQQNYPEIGCGLKRGFTYFQHEPGKPFESDPSHSRELAVAASAADETSDTHWVRADVDAFLAKEAVRLGVHLWDHTRLDGIERGPPWLLRGNREQTPICLRAQFVLDATGEAGVVPKHLGIRSRTDALHTRSRAIFSHFHGVEPMEGVLRQQSGFRDDYPFPCDDSAQHQILDRGWMWMLRFRKDLVTFPVQQFRDRETFGRDVGGIGRPAPNGRESPETALASVGIAVDLERDSKTAPLTACLTADAEWEGWLDRFPTVRHLMRGSSLAAMPGAILRTGRLQRQWETVIGEDWALLPHTCGFIDPLHSSGIAHSLCGIERLARILEHHWNQPTLHSALLGYQRAVLSELEVIDLMVHGCYMTMGHFPLLVSYAMLYFAGATTYETRRSESGYSETRWFLGADDNQWCGVVRQIHALVLQWRDAGRPAWPEFPAVVARHIAPYNHVGLCAAEANNMYRYTAPRD